MSFVKLKLSFLLLGRYAQDLMRAYPPFINFFENTKQTLEECDKTNPRFHAFLKVRNHVIAKNASTFF